MPTKDRDYHQYANPTFFDVDADGLLDLVVGIYCAHGLGYYRNGKLSSPAFTLQAGADNPFSEIKLSATPNATALSMLAPTFHDINQDGKPDLIVGAYHHTILIFRNAGSQNLLDLVLGPIF